MYLVSTNWEVCLPSAGCCLMLRNVEGKLRSSDAVIVAVVLLLETNVSGRKVDRRVLTTDIDAELGLITCVWDRIGQMARRSHPRAE